MALPYSIAKRQPSVAMLIAAAVAAIILGNASVPGPSGPEPPRPARAVEILIDTTAPSAGGSSGIHSYQ